MKTKCRLVSVSKAWRKTALPLLYEHLVITSPRRATMMLGALCREADNGTILRGHCTKHIQIFTHARGSESMQFLQTLFKIFRACPNLRILSGTWNRQPPAEFTQAIVQMYGPSLQSLYWDNAHASQFTRMNVFEFFSSFSTLRTLDLRELHYEPENTALPLSRPALPKIVELIVSSDKACLHVASTFRMPQLSRLTVVSKGRYTFNVQALNAFLMKHGQNLTTVNLLPHRLEDLPSAHCVPPAPFLQPDVCPVLDSLSFHISADPILPDTLEATPHYSLRRVALQGIKSHLLHPEPPSELSVWPGALSTKAHLFSLKKASFPALEIVRMPGFILDSDLEGSVKGTPLSASDLVYWWTDRFANEDVILVDGSGTMWWLEDEEELGTQQQIPVQTVTTMINAARKQTSTLDSSAFPMGV